MIKATHITTTFINGQPVRDTRSKKFFKEKNARRWLEKRLPK